MACPVEVVRLKDAWEGQVRRVFLIANLLTPLALVPMLPFLSPSHWKLTTTAVVLGAIYLAIFAVILLARRQFMQKWYSDNRFVDGPFEVARPRLEAAFDSAGLAHRAVATDDPQIRVKYELGRGLGAELFMGKRNEKCVIYVWPVNDRTRRDVEALKRSVDAAFPPAR